MGINKNIIFKNGETTMTINEFIEEKTCKQNRDNVSMLMDDVKEYFATGVESKDLKKCIKKIETYIEMYNTKDDVRSILHQIEIDFMKAVLFSKNAVRQSIAEKCQIEYLKFHGVNIEKLPGTGCNAKKFGNAKSVDALINGTENICLKHLKEPGGAQDNQIIDVEKFLGVGNEHTKNINDNSTFTVLLSGKYGESKTIELKRKYSFNNRIRVCTFEEYLNE